MLDDLKRMVVFSRVVEAGSFSAAALRLGIAKSAVSKHVSLLEKSIGARLLNRTTRGLSLTDVGETYYESCNRIIEAAEAAQQYSAMLQDEPHGTLRIASPASFGVEHIAPLLNSFLALHPSLKAELLLDDRVIDMVQENIDVAIRVGWLPDSSFRARKLRNAQRLLCASPAYLERMGTPRTADDLMQHEWVIFTLLPTPYHCELKRKNRSRTIHVKGRIKTNSASAARKLALEGAGITLLTDFLLSEEIKKGNLVQLLPDYEITSAGIYAVYQHQQHQQAKIRHFIDYLAENLQY
jgi:DNA-binding transcriptional LysR family regulator